MIKIKEIIAKYGLYVLGLFVVLFLLAGLLSDRRETKGANKAEALLKEAEISKAKLEVKAVEYDLLKDSLNAYREELKDVQKRQRIISLKLVKQNAKNYKFLDSLNRAIPVRPKY